MTDTLHHPDIIRSLHALLIELNAAQEADGGTILDSIHIEQQDDNSFEAVYIDPEDNVLALRTGVR